jgi:predicted phosphoribosyltransferase
MAVAARAAASKAAVAVLAAAVHRANGEQGGKFTWFSNARNGSVMFKNRLDAARQLAKALKAYQGQHPLVLAIPRGAVPMALVLARQLHGQMDVVLVHKLRAPWMPEVAIGAVDEYGDTCLAEHAQDLGADSHYIQKETAIQLKTLQQRRRQYTAIRAPISPTHRTVIVVDDGLATGATMLAALKTLRQHKPARLVCAVPVASAQALEYVKPWADELVCLLVPENFQGVGQFYEDFQPVEDAAVLQMMRSAAPLKP